MTITYANQQHRVIVIKQYNGLYTFLFPDLINMCVHPTYELNTSLRDAAHSIDETELHLKTKRVAPAYN